MDEIYGHSCAVRIKLGKGLPPRPVEAVRSEDGLSF